MAIFIMLCAVLDLSIVYYTFLMSVNYCIIVSFVLSSIFGPINYDY